MTLKDVYNLNPSGEYKMLEDAYRRLVDVFDSDLTEDQLYIKYKAYLAVWNYKFADRDPRYMKAADQLKDPLQFLNEGLFHSNFVIPRTKRDAYLYGDTKEEEYQRRYKLFRTAEFGETPPS